MKRPLLKSILTVILLSFISITAFLFYVSFKDYTEYFQTRRGVLKRVIESKGPVEGKYWVTLGNSDGFSVNCGLLVPKSAGRRYPAIILLGGKATGKYAIDYALDIDNVVILALDYPYEPRNSYSIWTIIYDIPQVRQAFFDMVPSAMLARDYLSSRKDVDTTKIVILGYSFGAPFVPVIAANERKIAAAVMIYGGGDVSSMVRHNVARFESSLLSGFLGAISGLLLRPMEPMRYADKISPVPLVMINGTDDEQIPRYNTELFFNAAKEPKKLIWIESRHVNVNNPELTHKIILALKKELIKLKILQTF